MAAPKSINPLTPAFEPVDLSELVMTLCQKATRVLTESRQHNLTVSTDGDWPAVVRGNYTSLRRLVWILIENAAKYTPSPGAIRVRVSAAENEVILSVEDNGIGISKRDLGHIFERFYRADPSRGGVEGAGLGLSIAKWIADVHNAHISVESSEGVGSVFRARFTAFHEIPPHAALPLNSAPFIV